MEEEESVHREQREPREAPKKKLETREKKSLFDKEPRSKAIRKMWTFNSFPSPCSLALVKPSRTKGIGIHHFWLFWNWRLSFANRPESIASRSTWGIVLVRDFLRSMNGLIFLNWKKWLNFAAVLYHRRFSISGQGTKNCREVISLRCPLSSSVLHCNVLVNKPCHCRRSAAVLHGQSVHTLLARSFTWELSLSFILVRKKDKREVKPDQKVPQ